MAAQRRADCLRVGVRRGREQTSGNGRGQQPAIRLRNRGLVFHGPSPTSRRVVTSERNIPHLQWLRCQQSSDSRKETEFGLLTNVRTRTARLSPTPPCTLAARANERGAL